eukprot:tig00001041_g6566.t1
MPVVHVSTDAEFSKYTKGRDAKKLCVIDWTATWCGPCKRIAPIYEQLASKYTDVDFLKIDVDEAADLAGQQNVRSMPTFHFWQDGKLAGSFSGADPGKLESMIQQLTGVIPPTGEPMHQAPPSANGNLWLLIVIGVVLYWYMNR